MIEKILPIMLCWVSNDLFATNKCRILHIEFLTSSKKKLGIKLLINVVLISCIYPAFLKYEFKNGVSDVNFEI